MRGFPVGLPTIAAVLGEPSGQGWSQLVELLIAFGLSSIVGFERQVRGKSAGLRTQTIVGTSAALILLVSKYGFTDVLHSGTVVLDPSRVAAQIVSGVGFLGAGLIITRQGTIRGLTTAASVWETAAIGMAAGAGLPVLAVIVTALHFVVVVGYTRLTWLLPRAAGDTVRLRVVYADQQGVLRALLAACTSRGWSVVNLAIERAPGDKGVGELLGPPDGSAATVAIALTLSGREVASAPSVLAGVGGVEAIDRADDESE